MSAASSTATLEALATRLGELEQEHASEVADLKQEIARQQERMASYEAEIARWQAERAGGLEKAGRPALMRQASALHDKRTQRSQRTERTSRRKLLQLGGAAAAATVGAGVLLNEQSGTAVAAPQHFASAPYEGDATGSGNWGLKGVGTSAAQGVIGTSDLSVAVQGRSTSGMGVEGLSTNSIGVYGQSTNDVGVSGSGGTYGGSFGGAVAPLLLQPNFGASGPPTTGTHQPGEVYLDSNAVVWVCVASGSPGTWKQVVAVPSPSTVTLQESASGLSHIALEGDGTSGADGVHGTSDTGAGVVGQSSSGLGVSGTSSSNSGVVGASSSGYGVLGFSTYIGGSFTGTVAPLRLGPHNTVGAPTADTHGVGEIYLDKNAAMWVCVAFGTPGTWVRLAGVANGAGGGATTFLSSPIRILDTRGGAPITNGGLPLAGGGTLVVQVSGTSVGGISVPAGASAVVGNLTALPFANGDLTIWQDGTARPNVSNLNYTTGINVANFCMAALSAAGQVDIYAHVGTTHVLFDVTGYML